VNSSYQELGTFQKAAGIGDALIYRHEDAKFQRFEGQTVALLGSWKPDSQNQTESLVADFDPKIGYLNAQTILVRVSGEEARCRHILEKLDWAALKGLMGSGS
jgi:hypothetical protein